MPSLCEVSSLPEATIGEVARWYLRSDVPSGFVGVAPVVLSMVHRLSEGDWHRCVKDLNGSVVVYNHKVW